ncbi:hypothetical protein SAMN05421810_103396 [Amycolatopsis arida]|uniref:Glyoxalase-like domain-containing protein n=1 Tax=Amycolatopsis arida TaxID=587909 RepID=A0A1I5T5A6_9PSEU|nr:VOC family protein [Amycolatopsis arida]TDX96225.1 hypothetical protein CLV69_103362 [Amycolatopsis arida]SFP78185.1 hypothetical protein SAMN05421810_103396 [Amycolatopsis arida]
MELQLTVDCADPGRMVAFWAEALRELGYVPEPPPSGFATWRAYWQAVGVPPEELPPGTGEAPESLVDPTGRWPRIWFQQVPEPKVTKNRMHLDLKMGGGRDVPLAERTRRVDTAVERLTAAGATVLRTMDEPGRDYYCVVLRDPEGTEFCVG